MFVYSWSLVIKFFIKLELEFKTVPWNICSVAHDVDFFLIFFIF